VSLEGWIITLAGLVASRWVAKRTGERRFRHLVGLGVVAIALLKGSSPGGRKARRAFNEARHASAAAGQG
jgi:hypothetical protein